MVPKVEGSWKGAVYRPRSPRWPGLTVWVPAQRNIAGRRVRVTIGVLTRGGIAAVGVPPRPDGAHIEPVRVPPGSGGHAFSCHHVTKQQRDEGERQEEEFEHDLAFPRGQVLGFP